MTYCVAFVIWEIFRPSFIDFQHYPNKTVTDSENILSKLKFENLNGCLKNKFLHFFGKIALQIIATKLEGVKLKKLAP